MTPNAETLLNTSNYLRALSDELRETSKHVEGRGSAYYRRLALFAEIFSQQAWVDFMADMNANIALASEDVA